MPATHTTDELGVPLMISDAASPPSDVAKPQDTAEPFANSHTNVTSTKAHTRPPIPGLTGLRAVLMMHVLVRNMHNYNAVDEFGWMVEAGAVGVSTFFVLSGFILAYCYGDHRFDTWRCYFAFIGRRYARLFPIYLLSQLMCVGEQVNTVRRYGTNVWTYLHWAAVLTGTQMWWPWPEYQPSDVPSFRGELMFNPTLWALSVVLFFYVTMPVQMRFIRWCVGVDRLSELPKGRSTARLLHLGVLCIGLVCAELLVAEYTGYHWVLFLAYTRVPEFALGLVVAALYLSIAARQKQAAHPSDNDLSAIPEPADRLLDYLANTPLLNAPQALDVVTALTVTLVILLGLPFVVLPSCFASGAWLVAAIAYIVLTIALTSGKGGIFNRLLSSRLVQELGGMSFCF